MAPLLIGALLLAAASAAPHALATYPAAFSEEEVRAIVALFASSEPTRDAREDDQVARTNRWLPRKALADGTVDWIAKRVLEKHGAEAWGGVDARALLATRVEFVLLHEFGEGDYFGWHVDVEPGDPEGLRRYLNVNVLLSAPDRAGVETTVGGDFGGGHLEVGGSNASLAPGSLYAGAGEGTKTGTSTIARPFRRAFHKRTSDRERKVETKKSPTGSSRSTRRPSRTASVP